MCEKTFLKALLCIFNVLLWLGGAVLVFIGVWMMVDPTIVNYLEVIDIQENDAMLSMATYVLMGAGALSFVVGLVGCCGAIREHQGLLFLYAALLFVVLLAEIAGAGLAFYYRTQIEGRIVTTMQKQIKNDFYNGTTTYTAWNFMQPKMKCCGAVGVDDYKNSMWWNDTNTRGGKYVPVTCCVPANGSETSGGKVTPLDAARCQNDAGKHMNSSTFYFTDGCVNKMEDWLEGNTLCLTIIALGVALSQLLGVVLACCLRSALRTAPGKENI